MKKQIVVKDTYKKGTTLTRSQVVEMINPNDNPEFEVHQRILYTDGSQSLKLSIHIPLNIGKTNEKTGPARNF